MLLLAGLGPDHSRRQAELPTPECVGLAQPQPGAKDQQEHGTQGWRIVQLYRALAVRPPLASQHPLDALQLARQQPALALDIFLGNLGLALVAGRSVERLNIGAVFRGV